MRQVKLIARPRRQSVRTADSRHTEPIAPKLLGRAFDASAPKWIWLAEISYVAIRQDWLYLVLVLDLHSRRVVGWSMQNNIERSLVIEALTDARERQQPPAGLLLIASAAANTPASTISAAGRGERAGTQHNQRSYRTLL